MPITKNARLDDTACFSGTKKNIQDASGTPLLVYTKASLSKHSSLPVRHLCSSNIDYSLTFSLSYNGGGVGKEEGALSASAYSFLPVMATIVVIMEGIGRSLYSLWDSPPPAFNLPLALSYDAHVF